MGTGQTTHLRYLSGLLLRAALVLFLFAKGFAVVYHHRISDRVMTTRYGKVRGLEVTFPGNKLRPVEAYFGLRYGDLDGGGMRFMPPKNPKEQWNGIRVAMKHQPVCPQPVKHEQEYSKQLPEARVAHLRNITPYLTDQKEDCLTLNLFVPKQEWNDTAPMAVMVFVHGESYQTGTGNAYEGSVLASFGDVIVVTLNYRLGVLGFLSTGDQSAMGNYALLDVIQALLWLKENIPSFNGDPQRVTLFGHGTGAAIVNLLLLSPFVYDLRGNIFQRAIIQSGSASSTWAMSYDPKWCTEKLAIKVNCSRHIANTKDLVHCLRERSDVTLVNSTPNAPKYYSCFAPSIDSWTVLTHEVDKLLREPNSKFSTVPVMFGVTKNEAYAYLNQDDIRKGISEFRKAQIIRTYVQNVFRYHRQKIYAILDHLYTDWTRPPDPKSNRDSILELLSDGQFVAPLVQMANIHSETADTYLYSFAYSTQSETQNENEEDVQGIHGDELPYVFGSPLVDGVSPFPTSYTNAERMLSEAVMTYWTNFAKTGNPNEPRNQTSVFGEKVSNRFVDLKWPKYTKDKQEYLPIGRRPVVRSHYRALKMAAWLDLIPKIDKSDGGDQSSHLLEQSDNMSTFDDPLHLIPNFDGIFPSPPPMPPVRPTPMPSSDVPWTTHYPDVTEDNPLPKDMKASSQAAESKKDQHSGETTAEPDKGFTYKSSAGAGVPLSIVVAIGGSLLLINAIIFAGLCYQRERIRKMRLLSKPLSGPDMDIDEIRLNRKLESNRSSPCPMGSSGNAPECISLMSGASAHQHATSPMKHTQGNTHVHNPSPQPSLHSRRGQSQLRTTPPIEPVACNYTAVPTQITSPVHRTHIGVSQGGTSASDRGADMNTYVNSKIRSPLDSNHKSESCGPIGGGGLSTFNPGPRGGPVAPVTAPSVPNNLALNAGGHPPPPPPASTGDDPLYKTINKTGQNNAVTIV